jgi:hypothetical protein
MFEWIAGAIDILTLIARAGIYLLAIIGVGTAYHQTRSFLPTLGALILAGAVIWGVSQAGQDNLRDKINRDAQNSAPMFVEGSSGTTAPVLYAVVVGT